MFRADPSGTVADATGTLSSGGSGTVSPESHLVSQVWFSIDRHPVLPHVPSGHSLHSLWFDLHGLLHNPSTLPRHELVDNFTWTLTGATLLSLYALPRAILPITPVYKRTR